MKTQEDIEVTQMVRIGTLMFEMNCFNAMYPVLGNYINDICGRNDWKIYIDDFWLEVLQAINQAQCESIDIKLLEIQHISQEPSILYYLSFSKFHALKKLNLDNLRLTNIETLTFLDAQNLQEINLSSNMITSFNSLNKLNWSNLNFLSIKANKSPQIYLHRTKIPKKCLSFNFDASYDMIQVQDLSSLMKLEPNKFASIDLSMSNFVIFNPNLRARLVRKAQTFVIFWGNMFGSYSEDYLIQ